MTYANISIPVPYFPGDVMHEFSWRIIMPHVIVKLYPGRSKEQKIKLGEKTRVASQILNI